MKKNKSFPVAIAVIVFIAVACGPKPQPGRPAPVERPNWDDVRATEALNKIADEYRKDPENFLNNRTYVWSDTWIWPETIGIGAKHMELMKKIFAEGDGYTREIVLNVFLMNIPPNKLKTANKNFLRELVILDTDIKERRANVPPPSNFEEEVIERYMPPE